MNLKDICHVQEARKLVVLQTGIQSSFYFFVLLLFVLFLPFVLFIQRHDPSLNSFIRFCKTYPLSKREGKSI